jgi:hypothetical protein
MLQIAALRRQTSGCIAQHRIEYRAGLGRCRINRAAGQFSTVPIHSSRDRRLTMFAIVYKTDGVPICVQVPGVSPDPVVVWNSEGAAKAFIDGRGGSTAFQPIAVNDEIMDKLAQAMGCPVEKLMVEPYPS